MIQDNSSRPLIPHSQHLISDLLISSSPYLLISLSPHLHVFLPAVFWHLPDDALGSEFTVKFWIDAFAAIVNVKALAALLAESCLVFLTDTNCLPIRVISTLHFNFPFRIMIHWESLWVQGYPRFILIDERTILAIEWPIIRESSNRLYGLNLSIGLINQSREGIFYKI